mgnify:CR=1 FL=1
MAPSISPKIEIKTSVKVEVKPAIAPKIENKAPTKVEVTPAIAPKIVTPAPAPAIKIEKPLDLYQDAFLKEHTLYIDGSQANNFEI